MLATLLLLIASFGLFEPVDAAKFAPSSVQLMWLRVDPRNPQTILLEGTFLHCPPPGPTRRCA